MNADCTADAHASPQQGPQPAALSQNPNAHPAKMGSARWLGPGLIMAASGIGASDIITATVVGATYGVALLWAVALGAFFKFVLSEGLARWQLATGTTLIEGWACYLPRWALTVFMGYLVLWSIAVSGALVSGCGLAIENITRGSVPRSWGGFVHALLAFGFICSARSSGFSRVMKPLIVVMFFSIVACAALTFREPATVLKGIVVPMIPPNGATFVLSLIGGIGGSVTLLSYNYLPHHGEGGNASTLKSVRIDLVMAYLFTAIFAISVMLIASRVFHAAGVPISDREAVSRMAGQLADITGPAGYYIYSIGFWAAVLASLIGVWQTVPLIFVDCYSLLRRFPQSDRNAAMIQSSREYRGALAFMALASMPFAFIDRPLLIVVGFTIIGSLFIPFLAATLLHLNNRVHWASSIPRNSTMTNAALVLALVLFLIVGGLEMFRAVAEP